MGRPPSTLARALALGFLLGCGAPQRAPTPAPQRCPRALVPLLPNESQSWLFARPRALWQHPQLGPAVRQFLGDDGEVSLLRRAERLGYDVRTLERGAVAWTEQGAVYLAAGAFDAPRVSGLFWESLLAGRRRGSEPGRPWVSRVEGPRARTYVALRVDPRCGVAGYVENERPWLLDRAQAGNDAADPEPLLVYQARAPFGASPGGAVGSLVGRLRVVQVTLRPRPAGLRVALRLEGDLGADPIPRVRSVLRALLDDPLGDLLAASQWLDPERVPMERGPGTLLAAVELPWERLEAIARALRGAEARGELPWQSEPAPTPAR